MDFGHPAMDDCAVAEIGGDGFKAGVSEGVPVTPITGCCETETFCHE